MKAKIKKVHNSWNMLFRDEFVIGETVDVIFGGKEIKVKTKNGHVFNLIDLCSVYSNNTTLTDILQPYIVLTTGEIVEIDSLTKAIAQAQDFVTMHQQVKIDSQTNPDVRYFKSAHERWNDILNKLNEIIAERDGK